MKKKKLRDQSSEYQKYASALSEAIFLPFHESWMRLFASLVELKSHPSDTRILIEIVGNVGALTAYTDGIGVELENSLPQTIYNALKEAIEIWKGRKNKTLTAESFLQIHIPEGASLRGELQDLILRNSLLDADPVGNG